MNKHRKHAKLHKSKFLGQTDRSRYLKRKITFWVGLGIFFILTTWIVIGWSGAMEDEASQIRAGICGAVLQESVYDMPFYSDLGMLVRRAGGLSPRADIRGIDLETPIRHDSIYHIPMRHMLPDGKVELNHLYQDVTSSLYETPAPLAAELAAFYLPPDFKPMNILYIGLPAVYALIEYYPDLQFINFLHIPHSSVLLGKDYRIIDIFFSMGIEPTMKILQRNLGVNIDHYMIQDQHAFIRLIDALDGIDVDIDPSFADAYSLEAGNARLNGFYAWEYIRFLDFKRIRPHVDRSRLELITADNLQAAPAAWQHAYEIRNRRQRNAVRAMREAFFRLDPVNHSQLIQKIPGSFETNIKPSVVLDMYSKLLGSPEFFFGYLPGQYEQKSNELFYYPDFPGFARLRNQEIRKRLNRVSSEQDKVVY